MQIARAAGIPAPKVLSVGEHPPGSTFWPVSILMTRLPGLELINIDMPFEENLEGPWVGELKKCLDTMRTWDSPYGQRICSPINTSIKSSRVPKHVMGPFENEAALHEYLLKPASSHSFASREKYEETLALARRIQERPHQVVFTHGDFKEHNVLVDDDSNLTGWLDWESAGWYPEYWEFTTARRMGRDTWWGQAVSGLGGDRYEEELESDIALNQLTVDSYVAF
jgi:aminoglycoside phosphotransferase